jgi:hypothetical protein
VGACARAAAANAMQATAWRIPANDAATSRIAASYHAPDTGAGGEEVSGDPHVKRCRRLALRCGPRSELSPSEGEADRDDVARVELVGQGGSVARRMATALLAVDVKPAQTAVHAEIDDVEADVGHLRRRRRSVRNARVTCSYRLPPSRRRACRLCSNPKVLVQVKGSSQKEPQRPRRPQRKWISAQFKLTKRRTPSFNSFTLKLINKPTLHPDSLT